MCLPFEERIANTNKDFQISIFDFQFFSAPNACLWLTYEPCFAYMCFSKDNFLISTLKFQIGGVPDGSSLACDVWSGSGVGCCF